MGNEEFKNYLQLAAEFVDKLPEGAEILRIDIYEFQPRGEMAVRIQLSGEFNFRKFAECAGVKVWRKRFDDIHMYANMFGCTAIKVLTPLDPEYQEEAAR